MLHHDQYEVLKFLVVFWHRIFGPLSIRLQINPKERCLGSQVDLLARWPLQPRRQIQYLLSYRCRQYRKRITLLLALTTLQAHIIALYNSVELWLECVVLPHRAPHIREHNELVRIMVIGIWPPSIVIKVWLYSDSSFFSC